MKKIFIILILSILVFTFPLFRAVGGGFEEARPEDKEWDVHATNDIVRYVSHGNIIYGHQFGFVKKVGYANEIFWIIWSTCEADIKKFDGEKCSLLIDADGMIFYINISMQYLGKFAVTNVLVFTNLEATSKMTELFERTKKVRVEIVGPKEILDYFDIPSDSFHLDGYIEGRQKAKKLFEELNPQKKEKAIPTHLRTAAVRKAVRKKGQEI